MTEVAMLGGEASTVQNDLRHSLEEEGSLNEGIMGTLKVNQFQNGLGHEEVGPFSVDQEEQVLLIKVQLQQESQDILDVALSQLVDQHQVDYRELRLNVQNLFDKEMTTEYEKRERMVSRVLEVERENQKLIT